MNWTRSVATEEILTMFVVKVKIGMNISGWLLCQNVCSDKHVIFNKLNIMHVLLVYVVLNKMCLYEHYYKFVLREFNLIK